MEKFKVVTIIKFLKMNESYNAIQRCRSYLEHQRKSGYSDAIHILLFPKTGVGSNNYDLHKGVIFQRALICDALLDALDAGFKIDRKGMIEDLKSLINSKCTDVQGGWRYFPALQYLPPDADDLGQILQVLVRSQIGDVSVLVDEAINLIFTQGRSSDGSFETWIIDMNDQSELNKSIIKAIENMWGKGPDVEVMANLLYALNMYKPKKYNLEIKEGCEFIIRSQTPSGYWNSTWYVDKFYATFVCTRLISLLSPYNPCLHNAYAFILDSQKQDGAWGDGEGNPLQTSFALLSLIAVMQSNDSVNRTAIHKGIRYLIRNQNEQGFWKASPFIQMNTNRASNQKGSGYPRFITYQSNTISSTFCLKALSQLYRKNIKLQGEY